MSWNVSWFDNSGRYCEPADDEPAALRRQTELRGSGRAAIAWETDDQEDAS